MNENNLAINSLEMENERLKVMIQDLALMVGMLRGLLFEYEDNMQVNKYKTLKRIDNSIELLFYTKYFKEKTE